MTTTFLTVTCLAISAATSRAVAYSCFPLIRTTFSPRPFSWVTTLAESTDSEPTMYAVFADAARRFSSVVVSVGNPVFVDSRSGPPTALASGPASAVSMNAAGSPLAMTTAFAPTGVRAATETATAYGLLPPRRL